MKILCIIPARSGSKGIRNKNIKKLKGHPLLAYSIFQARQSKYKMKIIVSTDSQEYAEIAKTYGAEVPFLRPSEISGDLSTDFMCIDHCVTWLKYNQSYNPEIILHLRPTQPYRKVEDIDHCLDIFINSDYDSLRSVIPIDKSPYKMYTISQKVNQKKNTTHSFLSTSLIPLFKSIPKIKEPYNQCRQALPQCFLHNGYIDILRTNILKNKTISGEKIYPFVMKKTENIDIDNDKDWERAVERRQAS